MYGIPDADTIGEETCFQFIIYIIWLLFVVPLLAARCSSVLVALRLFWFLLSDIECYSFIFISSWSSRYWHPDYACFHCLRDRVARIFSFLLNAFFKDQNVATDVLSVWHELLKLPSTLAALSLTCKSGTTVKVGTAMAESLTSGTAEMRLITVDSSKHSITPTQRLKRSEMPTQTVREADLCRLTPASDCSGASSESVDSWFSSHLVDTRPTLTIENVWQRTIRTTIENAQSFLPFSRTPVAAPCHNLWQQQEKHDEREDDGASEVDSGDESPTNDCSSTVRCYYH